MTPADWTPTVAAHLAGVREGIARAARQAGRRPEEITLLAVTKRQPAEAVQAVVAAGAAEIGESYVQEAAAKRQALESVALQARWHLIGHLQRNKAARAVALFDCVQSVDSLKLAEALNREAALAGKILPVLLQVHLGEETTKSGVPPEMAHGIAAQIAELGSLRLDGLMGIAPLTGDPRPHFAALRRLFDGLPPANRRTLSMGMSGDYEAAIAEGATMVRIGTSIFGPRP